MNYNVFGGYSYPGAATSNSVIISGGTIDGFVYGGFSYGNATNNSVNISGESTLIRRFVYGGNSSNGNSNSNSVNISGGTIDGFVYGGNSSNGNSNSNSVNISGGTINSSVYGGYSQRCNIASNSVNISGGNFGSGIRIYAGYVKAPDNNTSIKDNAVNLGNTTTNLDNAKIYGFGSGYVTHSGNELHIGRAVDYDNEDKIKRDTDGNIIYKSDETTIWQGKTSEGTVNNLVNEVSNFDVLSLYSVAWSNTLPAIAAESFTYNGSTALGGNVTLDITSLTFDKDYISGTMTLFQSDTDNNFNGIKLKYNDNEAATISDSGNVVKSATNQTLQSKGVKLTYDFEHSVSRSDSDKKVNFTALNTFKEAELGSMKWSDGGYTFANTDVIDANGFVVSFADNFKVEGAEDKNEGDSLDLLDLSSITGATINEAIARTKTLTYDKNPTSAASLTLSLSQADSIETNADKNKVTYTIGTKNVTKATFDKELVWNTSQPFYDASNSGYTFDSNTAIDAKNLNFALSDNQKAALKANDTMTLISASGITDSNSITQPDNYTFQLSRTGNSGTKFDGTAEGAVFAETSAVKYRINKIETDKITLGSRSWSANSESLPDTWTAKTGMVIDASDFAFTTKAETVLASGDTRTLVEGSGIVAGSNIADKTVGIDYTDNSLKLGATAFGKIETITEAVQFKVDSVALDSVDISGWKSTDDVSAVPDVWGTNANGVNVTATNFNPALTSGSKTIITASTNMFKDENIDESIRYKKHDSFEDSLKGVSLSGYQTGGVKSSDDGMKLTYHAMFKDVYDITFGEMKWGEGRIIDSDSIYDFKNVTKIDATDLIFTNPEIMSGTMNIVEGAKNLGAGIEVIGGSHKQNFDTSLDNKAVISATLTGEVSVEVEKVKYALDEITINKFDFANWDGEKASSVNDSWKLAESATVETDGMSNLPGSDEEKQVFILKSDTEGYFANVAINGENVFSQKQFTDSNEDESLVLSGTQGIGVTLDSAKTNLVYKVGSKDVTSLKLNSVLFEDGAELLNRDKYNYSKLTSLDTDAFNITFEKPETITVNQSMTILKANNTLTDIAAVEKSNAYSYSPVSGVTMDAIILSRLEAKSGKVALTAFSNKADKLTFGYVEWLDKSALIEHKTLLNNVSFDGAAVDTTKIAFTNKQKLDADMQMTLVSDFGDSVGTITGDKYKVGTAYEGEGSAYLDGSDLVFKIKTGAGLSDETHTTVMSMDASVAVLAAGSEQIGTAIEGLGNAANIAPDGTATFAAVGGGSARYKTGSHVDTNSWNIALAVGKNLEKKDGTLEYGLFGEYGRGNYTLHMNGVEDAGSGNSRYTGGGFITKWTNSHNVYTEASFRLGNVKENTSNILHDGAGNGYGYDKKAKYKGGHIGFGKKYKEDENTELEIYGKFFYNERECINFAAGADQYSLDKVRSRVLRAGFRLASTDRKWKRYGGIAYDHEFGGKSTGTVNGTAIRSASIKGGTIRGEFGFRREATKTNPWKTDISLYGFTGKRNGVGGSIAVEYQFW